MRSNRHEHIQSHQLLGNVPFTRARPFVGVALVVYALGFALPSAAQSVATVELTGEPSSSGISGFPGSKFTLGDSDSSSRALVGVLSRERSDEPCSVSVGWEDVNQFGTNDAVTKDLCGNKGPNSGTMGATYANTGGTANRVFITGAQVCMNKDDDRIKGIHLRGQQITDAGTLADFGPDAQDARTNCHQDHWRRWVNCPAGQIATAAILHFEAGNTPRSWIGIELRCRGLRVTGTTSSPSTAASSSSKGLAEIIGCNETDEKDIRAVAWNIADDWRNFSSSLENATGKNMGSCIEDRFSVNGKVECVYKEKCKQDGAKCKLGFGGGLSKKVKIYQSFFDNIGSMPQADRRACYAALMAHEFSHTCEHYAERGPEARAVAAFEYWKDRFPASSSLKVDDDCGLND